MRALRIIAAVLLVGAIHGSLVAEMAWAQAPGGTKAPQPPEAHEWFKRYDTTGYLGWYSANKPEVKSLYREWYTRSLYGGVSFGYYWTPHLKSEIELAGTSEGEILAEAIPIIEANVSYYRAVRHYFSNSSMSFRQSYQFRRNAWFHPVLGGGLELDRERHRSETPQLTRIVRVGDHFEEYQVAAGSGLSTSTSLEVKASLTGGFKAYLNERAYFRTDVAITGAKRIDQVTWRFGVGVDF